MTVVIGILTYQRPDSIAAALASLRPIDSASRSTAPGTAWRLAEVLVIDNDRVPSATDSVAAVQGLPAPVRYVHEPEPGLSAARNRALDECSADVLVFIDDDERADSDWPGALVELLTTTGAALVGGPVLTAFTAEPPTWIVNGDYFDRSGPEHGSEVDWLRTGNLAIDMAQVNAVGLRFDPAFSHSGGEDAAFSGTARDLGLVLRWSALGSVTEEVGPDRTTVRWVTGRARRAAAGYVRAELLTNRSTAKVLGIAARGGWRFAQGAATVLAGVVSLQSGRVIRGFVAVSRSVGYLDGLMDRRSNAYGDYQRGRPANPRR